MENLNKLVVYQGQGQVTIGDGNVIPITNFGKDIITTPTHKFVLQKLLHVHDASNNILSLSNFIVDNDVSISFYHYGYNNKDNWIRQVVLRGSCKNGLYKISKNKENISTLTTQKVNVSLWHQRLGHPHPQAKRTISKK